MACCKTDCSSVVSMLNPRKGQLQQAVDFLVQNQQRFEKDERQLELPSWNGSKKE